MEKGGVTKWQTPGKGGSSLIKQLGKQQATYRIVVKEGGEREKKGETNCIFPGGILFVESVLEG